MNEIWMPVKNHETYCKISNYGNVRSIRTGKLRKLQKHSDGYYCLIFYINNKSHIKYLHRLIAETFIPNPNNLPEVNHIDGNKLNNSIDNLEWCTHRQNIIHAYKNQLINHSYGITAKLNKNDVNEIRKLYPSHTQLELSKIFNISKSQIQRIVNNKSWKNCQKCQ